MDFTTLVKPEFVREGFVAEDSESALRGMSRILHEAGYVKESFEEGILERERRNPSGLPMEGAKIAIPHTNSEHVNESVLFFVRLAKPVVFRAMGDPDTTFPVQLISMFALKEAKKIGDLLEALINTYKDKTALEAILAASTADEIYSFLIDRLSQSRLE